MRRPPKRSGEMRQMAVMIVIRTQWTAGVDIPRRPRSLIIIDWGRLANFWAPGDPQFALEKRADGPLSAAMRKAKLQ